MVDLRYRRNGHRAQARGRAAWVMPTLALIGVAVPVGLATASFVVQMAAVPRYEANWCAEGREASSAVTVLIDRTDPLSERHRLAMHEVFEELASERSPAIGVHGRITVLAIDGQSGGLLRVVDSFCRPPLDGDESGTGATRKRLAPVYERYRERVRQAEASAAAVVPVSDWSPLLESVQALSVRSEFTPGIASRRLVLVSDLLQHVPGQLMEKDNATLKLPAFLHTTYGTQQRTDLHGIEVEVVYLERRRAKALQTPAHEAFWRNWLAEMGGTVARFRRIPE